MGFLSNKRERTRQQSEDITKRLLATTTSLPLLVSAANTSRDNWPWIVQNPHTPVEIMWAIERVATDSQLLEQIRAGAPLRRRRRLRAADRDVDRQMPAVGGRVGGVPQLVALVAQDADRAVGQRRVVIHDAVAGGAGAKRIRPHVVARVGLQLPDTGSHIGRAHDRRAVEMQRSPGRGARPLANRPVRAREQRAKIAHHGFSNTMITRMNEASDSSSARLLSTSTSVMRLTCVASI